ncbi:MAG: anti-sigma factor family protein [Pyrinomonadaceae bacterium]
MNEVNCDEVLMAWMAENDGEKSTLAVEQISAHIKSCGKCRQEVEQNMRVDSLLKRQARHQHDPNLWPAVEKRLGSRIVPGIGWAPFGLFGAIFVAYKLFEMLPEQAPGIAFKLVPLIFIVGLFVVIKENPFRINAELTSER